ncbi:hypothetical protein TYRP_011811 [Tyrophagus putrescentiae]|nr:hypothetical protein TYRP_011811 [Tyrophagus putrescentiae]
MLSTLTNLFVDGGGGAGGSQSFLHLLLTNTVACFLIGLSSMASLFAFNLLIHRRNPFSAVVRPVLNGNHHHHHHQNGHHLQNGHTGNGHLGNGHAQNGYHLVSSSPPPPPQSDPSKSELLRSVLSFAVGGLLGDVFLHLLPEASGQLMKSSTSGAGGGLQTVVDTQQYLGVRILAGIILFVIMESVFVQLSEADEDGEEEKEKKEKDEKRRGEREITLNLPAGAVVANGVLRYRGSPVKMEKMQQQLHQLHQQQQNSKAQSKAQSSSSPSSHSQPIDVTGYLNLLANGLDNFTHGMSVAASFLVSFKTGALTTLAIIIHEIPHEIADNAILLRSGFSCWAAFRAQLTISLVTFLGSADAKVVLCGFSPSPPVASSTLPSPVFFPELLTFEEGRKKSTNALRLLQRILLVLAGIGTMAAVNVVDIF